MIKSYVALDLETTGINPSTDRIIEIGAIKIVDGQEQECFNTFVNPRMKISERITKITGIDDNMVKNAPTIEEIIDRLMEFIGELPLLGHNIIFDFSFIKCAAVANGITFEKEGIDTLKIARRVLPSDISKKLEFLCGYMGIDPGSSHRAYDDARSAKILYEKLHEMCPEDEGFIKTQKLEFGIKKKSPITPAQLKYLNALVERHGITLNIEPESMTKSEASRQIDTILSTYGRI